MQQPSVQERARQQPALPNTCMPEQRILCCTAAHFASLHEYRVSPSGRPCRYLWTALRDLQILERIRASRSSGGMCLVRLPPAAQHHGCTSPVELSAGHWVIHLGQREKPLVGCFVALGQCYPNAGPVHRQLEEQQNV